LALKSSYSDQFLSDTDWVLPIGGIAETQEMLDFCGKNITAAVEVIPIQKVNEAYDRLLKADVKYRFAIDMASLKVEA
jgi:uncharacterized zinc-type alcohol dehydrogenase-like protein